MEPASRRKQRKILENAFQQGKSDQLYWYLTSNQVPVTDRRGQLPVVQVGLDDPATSLQWSHLFYEVIRHSAGLPNLATELTDLQLLESHFPGQWYLWGNVDLICGLCGGIGSCACQRDLGCSPYAVAYSESNPQKHVVKSGRALCGQDLETLTLQHAGSRSRRDWLLREAEFCTPCFEVWLAHKLEIH